MRVIAGHVKAMGFFLATAVAPNALGAAMGLSSSAPASTPTISSTTGGSTGVPVLGGSGSGSSSGGSDMYRRDHDPAPAPDPSRRINEQDCTKPIELNGGNLRCK